MAFRALIVEKPTPNATPLARIGMLEDTDLPDGEVTVAVAYSTLNYKDGLCLGPGGGLVRTYPHVPGVDFAGVVEASSDPRYAPGDEVVLTGWRVGEIRWGGYAAKARVKADWLVPLPAGLTLKRAMAIGTAGLTASLAIGALEARGLKPGGRPVLVTGAAGGVGSVATTLLSALDYDVVAETGRLETADYLRSLGATRVVDRADFADPPARPLEKETWSGAVDAVGGNMLARLLAQMEHGASVAAVGLAGGARFPGNVTPFLLRGITLVGIDSVMQPYEARVAAWGRLAGVCPLDKLDEMIVPATLSDLPRFGRDILAGKVRGRVVVDVNA